MSDSLKNRQNSFTPYMPYAFRPLGNQSVEISTDLMKASQIKNPLSEFFQSTDQIQSSFMMQQLPYVDMNQIPQIQQDGIMQEQWLQNQSKLCFIESSLDGKMWQKSRDGMIQQNMLMYYMPQFSPYGSMIPCFAPQQGDFKVSQNSMENKQLIQIQPPAQQQTQLQQIKTKRKGESHFKKSEFKLLKDESQSLESLPMIKKEDSSWEHSEPEVLPTRKANRRRIIDHDSSESYRVIKKKKTQKVNDTKNITKNYSKAVISYIISNPDLTCQYMNPDRYDDFVQFLRTKKNSMTNIKQLRDLWVDGGKNAEFNRAFRIMSNFFLRQQSVAYVYNSRISNTLWHLKYRYNLLRALHTPDNFKFIKDI